MLNETLYGPASEINPNDYSNAAIANTGDFGRGLAASTQSALAGAQRYVGDNGDAAENAASAAAWAPEISSYKQVHGLGDAARYVAGKVGGAVPYLAVGGIGAGLGRAVIGGGLGGELGGAAAFQPIMAGGEMQRMDNDPAAAGMSPLERRLRAEGSGALQSAIGAAVPAMMAGRLVTRAAAPSLRELPGAVARGALASTAEQGAAGAGMDLASQAGRASYDPNYQYDPEATEEAAVGNAVGMAPMGVAHSAVAHGLDVAEAGGLGAADVAKKVARTGLEAAVPAVGKAYDASKNLFGASADFYAQHPEYADLQSEQKLPPGVDSNDVESFGPALKADDARRNALAKTMAQRMLDNPDDHSNGDLHAARSMLSSTDDTAWKTFTGGVAVRQAGENVKEALGSAASYIKGKVDGLAAKATDAGQDLSDKADLVGIKHNLESTPLDDEFYKALRPTVDQATGGATSGIALPLDAIRDFVLSRFGDTDGDGVVDVPHGLVEAFGKNTPAVIAKAYDTLRRQGRTQAFDADAPALLNEVNDIVKEKQGVQKSAAQVVGDNLTPSSFDTIHHSRWDSMAQRMGEYVNRGEQNDHFERQMDQAFGPNKERALAQIAKLYEDYRVRGSKLDKGTDEARDTSETSEDSASDSATSDYENKLNEQDASTNYHFGDKNNTPFDTESEYTPAHMQRVLHGLDTSRMETTTDKATGKDQVRFDTVGVMDYARATGDYSAVNKLVEDHPDLTPKQLNKRFRVMRTRDKMVDESEPVDVKPHELAEPVTKAGSPNKASWQDVKTIGKKDVGGIDHGRIYMTKRSSDLVQHAGDETIPHEFVTSAQKLITKMWERKGRGAFDEHTNKQTGPKDMLNMFAAGLSSLLSSGKLHGEMRIRMPDGKMKVINGIKDLPDDFVLFRGKGHTVTLKDALKLSSPKERAAAQQKVRVNKETGKEMPPPRKETESFERSDIPGATLTELRTEYSRVSKQLLKDEYAQERTSAKRRDEIEEAFGEDAWQLKDAKPLPEEVRAALREKLDNLQEEGSQRTDNLPGRDVKKTAGPVGQDTRERRALAAKKQAAQHEADVKEIPLGMADVDTEVKTKPVVERPDMGLTEAQIREKHAGVSPLRMQRLIRTEAAHQRREEARIEGIKAKGEASLNTERHFIGESEEIASQNERKYQDTERSFDELTGAELHPKEIQSADSRVRLLDKRIAELRKDYKELNDKIKEYEGEAGANAVREANLRNWRKQRDALVEKGTKLSAERAALADAVAAAKNNAEAVDRMKRARETLDKEAELKSLREKIAAKHARLAAEKERGDALDKKYAAEQRADAEAAGQMTLKFNREAVGREGDNAKNVDAIDTIYKLIGKDVDAAFATPGALKGSATWTRDPSTHKAVIRIAADAFDPLSKAYHESMHEFFQRALDDNTLGGIHDTLRNAAESKLVMRQLERTFAHEPGVLDDLKSDPAERVAYMFQLWANDKLHVGPQTETVFRKMLNMVRKVLGIMSTDQKAIELMREFKEGNMSDQSAMAKVLSTQEARGATLRKMAAAVAPLTTRSGEWVGFAENALSGSKNPHLDWIGRQFNNKVGKQGDKQGLLSATEQMSNKFMNMFAESMRLGDKEDNEAALEGLQKKEWHADPTVRKIQDGIVDGFKKMFSYGEGAGLMRMDPESGTWVPMKKMDDYRVPVSWDAAKLTSNPGKFTKLLLEHHAAELEGIAKRANEEVANGSPAGEYTSSWNKLTNPDGKPITAEDVANAILSRMIRTNGQVELKESENELGFAPFMKSVNERTLNWIDQKVFHEFQEKDISKIISTYVGQITHRAEYSRRFGPDGGILQSKMEAAWHHEINTIMKEKYGVDNAMSKATGAMRALNAMAARGIGERTTWQEQLSKLAEGVDGNKVSLDAMKNLEPARRAIMAMEGTLGHDISPIARKLNAYSIVYQNIRLLGYPLLSSIIDPIGIMVNGGEFKDALSTLKRGLTGVAREWGALTGLREEKASDRDEATRVAEMVGTIDSGMFMSSMGNMYGSQYLGDTARNINDKFFRWNGMEPFNREMRIGATQAAISFIKRHYESPNEHSERYFKELNLDRKSVHIDKDGRLNVDNREVQQAIMRWVDGAILRPNAAMRPTMASDPHYATFYHLKQFMYATHAVINRRIITEIKHGNSNPLLLAFGAYLPVMMASDAFKGIIQTATGGGVPTWEHEGVAGVAAREFQRTGLLGPAQMAIDVPQYGVSGLFGPTAEQITTAFTQPIGKTIASALMVGPAHLDVNGMALND
jgi:hypothetical protein